MEKNSSRSEEESISCVRRNVSTGDTNTKSLLDLLLLACGNGAGAGGGGGGQHSYLVVSLAMQQQQERTVLDDAEINYKS